jgi:hypothetical protein
LGLNSAGQRAGGPPHAQAHASGGSRTGMPQRADLQPAELRFKEEKISKLDAVPHTGTRHLLRRRSKTLRVIIPGPSPTSEQTLVAAQTETCNWRRVKFIRQ